MALLVFGSPEVRRAYVGAMRLVATANGSRPFEGDRAELVRKFAGLVGCAGCHGFSHSLDFSSLLGADEPWPDGETALATIRAGLTTEKDRLEAVHAGLLVAMFSPEPDPVAVQTARWIANALDCDEQLAGNVEQIANQNAAAAKSDVFRRFLSERIAVERGVIDAHMERHDLASITRPEMIERYHQLMAEAPAGSLGAEMRAFYNDAHFDVPGTPGSPLPVEFLGSHDVHHVLSGYNTTPQGEVYTAVFNAANASAGIGWLAVVLLQWHQGIKLGVFEAVHSHLDPEMMAAAAARGAQTKVDIYSAHWDWLSLLAQPLHEVRATIGIPPGGQVAPGESWGL
jgi:mono/diheme cytochrome c family protein